MQRRAVAVLAVALFATTAFALPTLAAGPAPFKAERDSLGHPDLSGFWSNASLTKEVRAAALGTQLNYSAEETRKMEAAEAKESADADRPTDPNEGAPKVGGGAVDKNLRPEFAAAGGDVGGYNRGWLDPGAHVMRVHGEARTSFLTTPNGQPPARKAGAAPEFVRPTGGGGALGSFDSYETRSLGERCIMGFGRNAGPPMLPNGFYNNNYQFLQTKDAFIINVEMVHDTRIVRLNSTHRTDGQRPWMGDSIGHWEGDTLVVETTNIPQAQAYRGSWRNLKVTERFARVGKDRVFYQYTLEDPTIWEKPWGGEYEFAALNGIIYEYACHEGNYALPGMLKGARLQEQDAAKAKAAAAGASAP